MGIVLSLAALLVAFAGGLGVALLLRAPDSRPDPFGVSGTALIFGTGLVSLSSFCLGFLVQGAALQWMVGCICVALALGALVKRGRTPRLSRLAVTLPQMTALALASIPLAFATWLSLYREGLDWDGLFNWASKARIAFLYHGAIPLRYYRAPDDFFHRTYPPLVPVFESWIYGFLGRIDESMIKLIGPYFYLAAALLLISAAYRESRRRWLGILVVLPFLLVPGLLKGDGSAASGYADFPLAAAYLCTVVYVVEFWRNRTLESARLAGVSAMLLPFIKADGAVPLLCVAVAVVPLVIGERRWKAGAWIILPGMAVVLGWWAFWKLNGVPRPGDFAAITPAVFLSHLDRAKPLLSWTFEELTTWGRWGLLWPLVAAALGGFFLYTRRSRWYPWFATVGLPLVLYPCAFFFSAWNPVEAHVKSSINRLVLQVAPAAALLVGTALAEFVENAGTSSSGQTGG